MYKLLLTFRYLRRKLIPLLAVAAVMLCVAMLIIVLSIMGGFLNLLETSGGKLIGDVKLLAGRDGFPGYDRLVAEIEALDEAKAATATIETIGVLTSPSGAIRPREAVIVGVDAQRLGRVTDFAETLYWTGDRLAEHGLRGDYGDADPVDAGAALVNPWRDTTRPVRDDPPAVVGIEVNPGNARTPGGTYQFYRPWLADRVNLTVFPLTEQGNVVAPQVDQFVIVNELHSGLYETDQKFVFVPFDVAQRLLMMDAAPEVDPETFQTIGEVPPRASSIIVRAADGVTPERLKAAVEARYASLASRIQGLMPLGMVQVVTWKELMGNMLRAVRNEKNLMTFLFGIISLVAVILILVIFYMIVLEKTRDIGVLRALGASRAGVASIFLSYAAAVGAVGAALGAVLGVLVVVFINDLHDWLGANFGIVIWDKSVYFFEKIPNDVNPVEVTVIVLAAVLSSTVGAVIPALLAARVDPVQSLRYE